MNPRAGLDEPFDRARCLVFLAAARAGAHSATSVAGCGSSAPAENGLLITGPGIRATAPPWPTQNQGLAQRIARLHLPAAGSEKFHIHALLRIYDQGLYVTVPANVGIDERHHVESSLVLLLARRGLNWVPRGD